MPTYRFCCPEHGTWEGWRSIHIDSSTSLCPQCEATSPKVFVEPAITSASPTVTAIHEREARWDKDRDAYKRMRNDGVQPKGIDGSARIEARANTETEVEMGKIMPLAKVREGVERSHEIMGTGA